MKKILIICLATIFTHCIPIPPITKDKVKKVVDPFAHKKFVTYDFNYEPTLKSVMLYPLGNITTQSLESPVIYLGQTAPLILEFDDLRAEKSSFSAKIVHCNQDWKISSLNEIEFINDLNLFEFDAPKASYNTRQKYFHYTFRVPPVKASGNYLLKVFRKGQERDLIMIKRFMVYEKKWEITPAVVTAGKDKPEQVIVCKVHYGGEELKNSKGVKVLIRQNQRWDNAVLINKSSGHEQANKNLLYKTILNAKTFRGGNEFRRFDMSSFRFIGQRIYSAETLETGNLVTLEVDRPRVSNTYTAKQDFNGGYIVQDERGGDAKFATDYAKVKFTLKCDELDDNVYVMGKFNNWKASPANEMIYNLETHQYEATLLLKQGIYDYMYGHKPEKGGVLFFQQIEGSHFKARNQYEVFVYYRPLNTRTDQLVGYTTFGSGD
ncbi:hypothetical protein BKI52_02320 [marine bacterium AO1-C]|nr:hypothetical protein BKI52_02320 [marine bacterium AO1-C]